MNAAQDAISRSSINFNGATGKLTTLQSQYEVEFNENSGDIQSSIKNARIAAYASTSIFGPLVVGIAAAIVEGKVVRDLNRKLTEIKNFHSESKLIIEKAFRKIKNSRRLLNDDILHIGDLKVRTEETNTFVYLDSNPYLRNIVIRSAQSLIGSCNNYPRKYTIY